METLIPLILINLVLWSIVGLTCYWDEKTKNHKS